MTLRRTLQLAFWAALVFAAVMAILPRPPELGAEIGDKYRHMLAFATLTVLAVAGYHRTPLLHIAERLSFLGAMIELVQSIPALRRDCDIVDWIVDTVVVVGVLAVVVLYRRARGGEWSSA